MADEEITIMSHAIPGWTVRFGIVCLLACLAMASGCTLQKTKSTDSLGGNYTFRETGQDVNTLIDALKKEEPRPLVSWSWIPLMRLRMQGFSQVGDPSKGVKGSSWTPDSPFSVSGEYLPGFLLADWRSFGPFFAYTMARANRYDPSGSTYDIQVSQYALFRLWGRNRTLVKISSGWREETRQEILFGLLPISHNVAFLPELRPEDLSASRVGALRESPSRITRSGLTDFSPPQGALARTASR